MQDVVAPAAPAPSQPILEVVRDAGEEVKRSVVKKRLARLFAPRADGTMLVPEELVKQYKDLNQREGLIDEFVQAGFDKDSGLLRKCVYASCPCLHVQASLAGEVCPQKRAQNQAPRE